MSSTKSVILSKPVRYKYLNIGSRLYFENAFYHFQSLPYSRHAICFNLFTKLDQTLLNYVLQNCNKVFAK